LYREGEVVAESKPPKPRTLQLEYRFDRLLSEKLAHAYQVLVPDKRRPLTTAESTCVTQPLEINHEQTSRNLRSSLFGSPEGESHDCQPDSGSTRPRGEKRIQRAEWNGCSKMKVTVARF
jgi:hypothetical protein